jgi:hypothetical protein
MRIKKAVNIISTRNTEDTTKTSVSDMGNKFKIRDGMNDKIGKMRSEYTSAIDSYFANRRGNKSRPIPEMKKNTIRKMARRLDICAK